MRPSTFRLILFASGDFAFNLYWQSVMLYLLFYYTDALDLSMGVAAATYLAASVWDGIASLAVGIIADRRGAARHYGLALTIGAVPLGCAFVFAYLPPPVAGVAGVAFVLGGHLLLRTAYALVNVPYLAMSARISRDTRDRSLVAGLRMLGGTGAAVTVALATVPVGRWLTGANGAQAYLGAAIVFATVATAILLLVGITFRDVAPPETGPRPSVRASLASLLANRAFVTLNAAMMAMIVGVTMLNKSVLYYFKYFLGDEAAGQLALGSMMAVSAVAVPLWMLVARAIGTRAVWLVAVALGAFGLAWFALFDPPGAVAMRMFLIALQVAIVGLHFVYWAMLPDTIDYGQSRTGVRAEGIVFGSAALLQRIAIGIATVLLGWGFDAAGYVANVAQSAATLDGMRRTIALVPLLFLLLSGAAMLANPLRRAQ